MTLDSRLLVLIKMSMTENGLSDMFKKLVHGIKC